MDRNPPEEVRRALRREVGFGCPVEGCSNPYLEYHHFDPAWRVREHHHVPGMIALCAEHHRKADAGAFTTSQMRALKQAPAGRVVGRFDWLRNDILAVVGGTLFYETPVIFQFKKEKAIWFERDADNNMLLNLRMVTLSGEPRLSMRNNDWVVLGNPSDFQSPPSGKRIRATYANGDSLSVEFSEMTDHASAVKRFPLESAGALAGLRFPVTVVEIEERIGGSECGFGPTWIRIPGVILAGGVVTRCRYGVLWN